MSRGEPGDFQLGSAVSRGRKEGERPKKGKEGRSEKKSQRGHGRDTGKKIKWGQKILKTEGSWG